MILLISSSSPSLPLNRIPSLSYLLLYSTLLYSTLLYSTLLYSTLPLPHLYILHLFQHTAVVFDEMKELERQVAEKKIKLEDLSLELDIVNEKYAVVTSLIIIRIFLACSVSISILISFIIITLT